MIQGVFDDVNGRSRYDGQLAMAAFDPEANTDGLIRALPQWYAYGLRAVTVCFQGGWPVDMVPSSEIDNNPFGADGLSMDAAYAARMAEAQYVGTTVTGGLAKTSPTATSVAQALAAAFRKF